MGIRGRARRQRGADFFVATNNGAKNFFHLLKQRGEDFSEILKERGEKVFQISFEKFENFLNFCQNIKISDIGSTHSVRKWHETSGISQRQNSFFFLKI